MRITGRTKKKLALLAALMVVAGSAGGGLLVLKNVRLARSLDVAIRDGTAAYEAGDYETAMRHLGYYVGKRKEHDAVVMLADARRNVPQENRRHIPQAITLARFATELEPESIRARELLLDLYLEAGYATEAASTADALLARSPGHRRAQETRIMALARLGKFDDAIAAAKAVAEAHPTDIDARRQVGHLIQLRGGTAAEIRDYLEQAADLAQSDFGFALLQAEAALLTGDVESAMERARHAATLQIRSGEGLKQFLRLLDTLASVKPEAQQIADAALAATFPPDLAGDVALIRVQRSWKAGRNDLAWESVKAAVEAAPSLEQAPAGTLGWWVLLRQAETEEAERASVERMVAELRRRTTVEAEYWVDVIEGSRALEEGDLKAAVQSLERAASRQPDAILPPFLLGHVDRRLGEWRRTVARWDSLLRQHPNWRSLRAAFIDVLIENGQFADAVSRAEVAMAWSPSRPEALQYCRSIMAILEARQADPAQVVALLRSLDSIVQQATADPDIQTCAARAYLAADRRELAARAVERVLAAENPPNAALLTPLALAYRAHDPAAAQRLLDLAPALISPAAVYAQAISLLEQDRRADARAIIDQRIAATRGRERLSYQLTLARFLAQAGDPEASAYLIALGSEHSQSPEVQTALLETDAVWTDEAPITAAIGRLREAVGSDGTAWRVHEARRLLTFTPSQARAAQAIQTLAPLIRQDGAQPMALMMVGEAYLLLDERGRAGEFLGRAIDAQPTSAAFYPRLIEVLQSAAQTDEAVRRLSAFGRIEPLSTDLRRKRAQLALSLAAWDQAFADFSTLAASGAAEDRFGLAIVHLRRGQAALAESILADLARLPQATPAMVIAAADIRAAKGDVPGGRQLIESAPADLPAQLRQAMVAAYLQRHGNSADAEAVLVAAASAEGANPDAVAELARFYLESGRLDEASRTLERGLAGSPDHVVLRRVRALVRIQSGENSPEAWALLAATIADWAEAPAGLRELTAAMQQRAARPDDTAGHIARLQQITVRFPSFFTGWQVLAQSLAERGDLARASDAALAAGRAIPTDHRPAQLATTLLIQQQRFDEALSVARQWRTRAPGNGLEPDLAMAWLFQQLARPLEGLRLLEPRREALLAARDSEHLTLYAGLLIDAGRVDDAGRVLFPLAEQSRQWALASIGLTERIKSDEAAQRWLMRIGLMLASAGGGEGSPGAGGENEPSARAAAQLILGEAWFRITSRTKAVPDAQRTIEALTVAAQEPSLRFTAHAIMAATNEAIGNRIEAERQYRLALAEQENDPIILNNFAYFLAQQEGGALEAVDLARRAIESARRASVAPPVLSAMLDTLGTACLAGGRWAEAEAAFREALQISPNAPDLLIGLAEARFGQGDGPEALTLIGRARERIAQGVSLSPTRVARLRQLEQQLGGQGR
jgi:tetratricopeptide (TPR) repeat protein